MEQYLEYVTVVNTTASLENDEGLAVDFNGELISTRGNGCFGVVTRGRPQDTASEAAARGVKKVRVDGNTAAVSINDPMTAGGGTITGQMTKATIGTHPVRGYAMEATTNSDAEIEVYLI